LPHSVLVVVGEEVGLLMKNVIAQREEDYSVFVCSLDIVIPGSRLRRAPE
jgi:hypothetical protein